MPCTYGLICYDWVSRSTGSRGTWMCGCILRDMYRFTYIIEDMILVLSIYDDQKNTCSMTGSEDLIFQVCLDLD